MSVLRHLHLLVRRHPNMGCRALAAELFEYQKKALLARPAGAVVTLPKLLSKNTVARSVPLFISVWNATPRYLKEFGLTNHRAVRAPFLTQLNMSRRVQFATRNENTTWSKV
jgi:hypothetical protein